MNPTKMLRAAMLALPVLAACGVSEEMKQAEEEANCYENGYDDGYYGESPDPDYWGCRGSRADDYCEGYCDGEYDGYGYTLECLYC